MKRVFIVEDEAVVALELKDHMRAAGFDVCGHAVRADTAFEQIIEVRPDLVLMDINLGSGITGLEVAERLGKNIPVVFLTAYSDQELTERVGRTGSYSYVLKPFVPEVLKANIELALARHEMMVAVREREAQYRALFEQAAVGVAETDATTERYVRVNQRFCEIVGYSADELLERGFMALTHPDDVAVTRDNTDRLRSGELAELSVEKRYVRKDGSTVWIHLAASRLWSPGEPPTRYMAVISDISERKRAEAALRDEEFLLSESQRIASVGSWIAEIATGVVRWTDETYRIFGQSRASFQPTAATMLALLHPDDRGSMQNWISASLAGNPPDPLEFRVIRADGVRTLVSRGELAPADRGAARHLIGTVQDITELRQAEVALEASEQRFAGVFESAPDALLIVDRAGRIVLANSAAESTFGYSRDELAQLTIEDLVPPRQRSDHVAHRTSYFASATVRPMASRGRLAALRKDGTQVPVEISLSPLRTTPDTMVVAAVRDVSERVRQEEAAARLHDQLRHAQKLEALGTLAGGIAHDFNNLLAAIVANLELARHDVADSASYLDEIAVASSRAADLVKQILTFSRRQPATRAVTSLDGILVEVATLLRATLPAGIRINTDLGDTRPCALIDPTQIHQVLMNLGTNAWHAIEQTTGTISLSLASVSVADETSPAAGLRSGRHVRIQVSDDGHGMSDAIRERIFEPFFTTKGIGRGTGLGLAVVHGIVTEHEGAITVESLPGHGTTFSVYLPQVEPSTSRTTSDRRPRVPSDPRKGRVLLVDDEEAVTRATTRLLVRLGYEVAGVVRARDAIEAVRAEPDRFDIVITDQNMPDMDGLELSREVAAIRGDLPIVLVSGNQRCTGNQRYTKDELAAANVRFLLEKPYDSSALDRVIRETLGLG